MPKTIAKDDMARLEARIPAQIYSQMQRAAELRGMTLTGYVLATAGEEARRILEETEILRLSRADQIAFAEALISPPQPGERLKRAAKRHAELIQPR